MDTDFYFGVLNPRHPRSKFFQFKVQTGRLGYASTSINSN